ncbi:MAG: zinc metallopeptidase [Clostridia bacterium]|nr:zinc metallopeptidase [Clostridia bacterium]
MVYTYGFGESATVLLSYGLIILAILLTLGAQLFVTATYKKYVKVPNSRGITGAQAARYYLDQHGLQSVGVVQGSGFLSDHYDPTSRTVTLSPDVYSKASIASVAVACHECGHAVQHQEGYFFMNIRSALVPIVNVCSYLGYIAIVIGALASMTNLIWLGIMAEMVILLFQVVTLPVEVNASRRAMRDVQSSNILCMGSEISQAKTVLTAAAMTYLASVAATLLQVLRLILIFGRRRN